jgi:hypothetical protein
MSRGMNGANGGVFIFSFNKLITGGKFSMHRFGPVTKGLEDRVRIGWLQYGN